MNFSPGIRLELRQQQSLVLTPQLQQAIRLLQMSNFELASVIDKEVAENPFLQRSDREARRQPAPPATAPTVRRALRDRAAAGIDGGGPGPPRFVPRTARSPSSARPATPSTTIAGRWRRG